MYSINASVSGKEEVLAKLSEIGQVPMGKLKAALNNWRFSLSNEIANSVTYSPLKKRTGALLKSAGNRKNIIVVEKDKNTLVVKFDKTLISYAYAHESGDTVKPKGKFLAIPLRGWRQLSDTSGKPLPLGSYKKKGSKETSTFLVRSGFSEGYTVYWKRRRERPIPIYLLRKKVDLPKRAWFEEAVIRALPSLRKIILRSQGMYE